MDTPDLLQRLPSRARFDTARMTKIDCFHSERLLVGLNCLEPGHTQRIHNHADADKFYFVISGKARFVVAGTVLEATAGDLVLAPAGMPHGIEIALERTIVLMALAPAPGKGTA